MKRFFNSLPKKMLFVGALLGSMLVAGTYATQAAFGPDRPTKEYTQGVAGFDQPTFNSFTNVPNIGDERNFLTGKIAGADGGFYDPMTKLRNGDEVLVRVYVHNGADESLNDNAGQTGVAKDTKVRVELPTGSSKTQQAEAFVSASNAVPAEVTDTLDMSAENGGFFELEYVPGSANIKTNFMDAPLSDNIVTDGVLIGDDALDGNLKGCFEYVALVTLKVRVKMPHYTVAKSVRFEGQTSADWKESVDAKVGDTVEYKIDFRNIGQTRLDDVAIFDELPPFVSLVPGSVKLYNSNFPQGHDFAGGDDILTNSINIGDYNPNSNGIVTLKAKVNDAEEIKCGTHKLENVAYATPGGYGTIGDTADVYIKNAPCEPEEPEEEPEVKCENLVINKVSRTKHEFVANADAFKATISKYTFVVTNEAGDTVSTQVVETGEANATATFETDQVGTYKVKVTVTSTLGDTTSTACEGTFTVDEAPVKPVYKCEELKLVSIVERKATFRPVITADGGAKLKDYTIDFGDDSDALLTDQETVEHTYAADGEYIARITRITFEVNGEDKVIKPENCAVTVKATTPETPVTPEQPTKLPSTGSAGIIGLFAGVSLLGAVLHNFVSGRKNS